MASSSQRAPVPVVGAGIPSAVLGALGKAAPLPEGSPIAGILSLGSFAKPDSVDTFPKARFEKLNVGGHNICRAFLEPGWKWSEHMQPIAKCNSCQNVHMCYLVAGRFRIKLDSGEEMIFMPGSVFALPAGHDAEVLGVERVEILDFAGVCHDWLKASSVCK